METRGFQHALEQAALADQQERKLLRDELRSAQQLLGILIERNGGEIRVDERDIRDCPEFDFVSFKDERQQAMGYSCFASPQS